LKLSKCVKRTNLSYIHPPGDSAKDLFIDKALLEICKNIG